MYELLYFSLPGLVVIASLLFWTGMPLNEAEVIGLVATSPLIGYMAHQLFRLIFEASGNRGHWRQGRVIIDRVIQECSRKGSKLSRKNAFLIWNLTLYSKDVPNIS